MSRISKRERDAVSAEIQAIYDGVQKVRGNVPNMFKTMAHRPGLLESLLPHFKVVMAESSLSVRLKELIVLRVSAINGTPY